MSRLIRSAVLSNYVEVARSVGLDPYRMISEFRLPPASLNDPDVKVPVGAVGRLLEESAARSGKLDFGLRLANKRTVANLVAHERAGRRGKAEPRIRRRPPRPHTTGRGTGCGFSASQPAAVVSRALEAANGVLHARRATKERCPSKILWHRCSVQSGFQWNRLSLG